jgi:large subunit ribosomal protein L30e
MDWNLFEQELKNTIETGKIIYGTNNVEKEMLIGEPKLLIVSKTIEQRYKELFEHYADILEIRVVEYPERAKELGSVCGKPFGVSVLVVTDFGKSNLLEALDKKKSAKKENAKVVAKKKKKEEKAKKEKKKIIEKKKEEEKEEAPIQEDAFFKDIIKIKKK